MDFELNEEQAQFQRVLRDFVDAEIVPVAKEWEQADRYPAEIIDKMAELGLFGLLVPEEYGGVDADFVTFTLVFEEIARGWMGIGGILGSHSVSTWMLARHGTEQQKRKYLPELATGARRTGIALTEPDAGTDLQGIRSTAERDGEHYVLNGSKMWITNARHADPLPVLVKTDRSAEPAHRGMSVLLVDADAPGFTVTKDIPKLGYKGTESCEVVFEDVRVPAENLLGGVEGRGMQQALSALETGRLNIAGRSLGIAQRSYDEAVAYAGEREAFGQAIGQFQAIQLRIAEMATRLQAARLLSYWSASKLDRGERADLETGMAKLHASEVALQAAQESMRVHGGYGYSKEFEIERLYRDSILMTIGEGTSDIMRTVIAKSLLAGKGKVGW
ncbi:MULTISPECIES: acyl-CoA dehydrogenase family protein [unclassified Saccharopolyspora]|uniref:acyl-CoA dehydrogenase family protein n=1 Tax=Saccharopolyspora TaxID=1835 RepID=UPI001909F01C|nr:acyl-CoA dehydrogenase family protein [Saccharopolyspora sp. HNM0986]MBK0866879.1 acyl-CoA dehydrogenase family protein [Saccharopolyspora sp. HNM0986]